jgi:hypothetical protein
MGYYTKNSDKKSGDGLSITEWNDLSSAVAGDSGLTLALNSADNVGIGASSPSAKLEVNGDVKAKGVLEVDGNIQFIGNRAIEFVRGGATATLGAVSHNHIRLGIPSDVFPSRFTIGSWSQKHPKEFTEFMRVTSKGNVGIGTDNPDAKLAINGGLHVGGDSDPGDNNLWVDGELKVKELATFKVLLTEAEENSVSARFSGGRGVEISNVEEGYHTLRLYSNTSSAALQIGQGGTGSTAILEGGGGLRIQDVNGRNFALWIRDINTDSGFPALVVEQTGNGSTASFKGGLVSIEGALTVTSEYAASFEGVGGVYIQGSLQVMGDKFIIGGQTFTKSDWGKLRRLLN